MKIRWMDEGGVEKNHAFGAHCEYEEGDPELLPCPFCGGDTLYLYNTHTPYFSVHCSDCGVDGPVDGPDTSLWLYKIKAMTREEYSESYKQAFLESITLWNKAKR